MLLSFMYYDYFLLSFFAAFLPACLPLSFPASLPPRLPTFLFFIFPFGRGLSSRFELQTSHTLSVCSTTELHPQIFLCFFMPLSYSFSRKANSISFSILACLFPQMNLSIYVIFQKRFSMNCFSELIYKLY